MATLDILFYKRRAAADIHFRKGDFIAVVIGSKTVQW